MRALHRDIGFLMIGLTVIYCLSGVILVYRNTDVFTVDKEYNESIQKNLDASELSKALGLRRLRVEKEVGDSIWFNYGVYDKHSGVAQYTIETYPDFIWTINGFHKSRSGDGVHWFAVVYGVLLLFLALSSFWMYKPKSKSFKRGIVISAIGIVLAAIALFL